MEVPLLTDDFLRRPVHLYPNKTAVVDGARRYTYAELQARVKPAVPGAPGSRRDNRTTASAS